MADNRSLGKCIRYFPDGTCMVQVNVGQQNVIQLIDLQLVKHAQKIGNCR